jgi:putative transposase
MAFNPEIHHRHSIRLPKYDYSRPGYYFFTLCAYHRECIFSDIEKNEIVLNDMGTLIKKNWYELPGYFPGIELDQMVIMPNHLHGTIIITDRCRGGVVPPLRDILPISKRNTPTAGAMVRGAMTAPLRRGKTLGQMIAWFKYESTREINRNVSGNPELKIWQRNFFDRIIRDDEELNRIRNYIATNPETWKDDENYVRM